MCAFRTVELYVLTTSKLATIVCVYVCVHIMCMQCPRCVIIIGLLLSGIGFLLIGPTYVFGLQS